MHFLAACVLIGRMCAGMLGSMEALRGTMQAEQRAAATLLFVWLRCILSPLQASILMVQVRLLAALVVMYRGIRTVLRWLQLRLPLHCRFGSTVRLVTLMIALTAPHLSHVSLHSGIACPAEGSNGHANADAHRVLEWSLALNIYMHLIYICT